MMLVLAFYLLDLVQGFESLPNSQMSNYEHFDTNEKKFDQLVDHFWINTGKKNEIESTYSSIVDYWYAAPFLLFLLLVIFRDMQRSNFNIKKNDNSLSLRNGSHPTCKVNEAKEENVEEQQKVPVKQEEDVKAQGAENVIVTLSLKKNYSQMLVAAAGDDDNLCAFVRDVTTPSDLSSLYTKQENTRTHTLANHNEVAPHQRAHASSGGSYKFKLQQDLVSLVKCKDFCILVPEVSVCRPAARQSALASLHDSSSFISVYTGTLRYGVQ